jgi:cholesterol oxidase
VVVGSGYGGAITASRLARAGQDVCLLERGAELLPGEYPSTLADARRGVQTDSAAGRVGSPTAICDLRVNNDINVLVGCGLGGTSLINANVSIRPDPRVFADARWPRAFRDDLETLLADGFARAEEMLRPMPYPADGEPLLKLTALERSAEALGTDLSRLSINVTFTDGPNVVGVQQYACTRCGNCVSGCNYGAKNTVLMNYLPDAKAHGAEIFCQVGVRHVERDGSRWRLHFHEVAGGRRRRAAPAGSVTADIVVLAGGSLGSTEILLRSQESGLPLSERVGHGFTGNGDVLGFAYNNDVPVNAIGFGPAPDDRREPVGPTITGAIDLRDGPELEDGMIIEEGAIPGAVGSAIAAAFATAAGLLGEDTDRGYSDRVAELRREVESLTKGAYHGALRNTQVYLVMAHDSGNGRISLEHDRVRVAWPGVGSEPIFAAVGERLVEATRPLGGTYLPNPISTRLSGHDLVTVHPLGGCVMAETAEDGAVNERGQVFSGAAGTAVHEGLYVSDGSVIPRSLGVNPLLTISAVAERGAALIAADRGWSIDYALPPPAASPPGELTAVATTPSDREEETRP